MENIPFGFCRCGCGNKTSICDRNRKKNNLIKGIPMMYLPGHSSTGTGNGFYIDGRGYKKVLDKKHHRSIGGFVFEHIIICENVLGKPIKRPHVIHHIDGDTLNNSNNNLIICENNGYHLLLHRKKRALLFSGNADNRKCSYCKGYFDRKEMITKNHGKTYFHKICRSEYGKKIKPRQKRIEYFKKHGIEIVYQVLYSV